MKTGAARCVIDTLGRFLVVSRLRPEDVGDERLRIAIIQGKPEERRDELRCYAENCSKNNFLGGKKKTFPAFPYPCSPREVKSVLSASARDKSKEDSWLAGRTWAKASHLGADNLAQLVGRMEARFNMAENKYDVIVENNAVKLAQTINALSLKGFRPMFMSSAANGEMNVVTVILENLTKY